MNDMTLSDTRLTHAAEAVFDAQIAATNIEADGVLSLQLTALPGASLPRWTPGAHIDVILPNGLVRQYSLCGDPGQSSWRIGVLREPASRGGSQCIHDELNVGDRIRIAGPRNNFKLVGADHYLFIAGGIGITPILAMIRQVAADGLPWTLLYGGRTRSSMAFLDEIAAVPGGEVHVAPQDECGLLDLPRFLGTHQPGTAVYCCGPGPLIDAVEEKCRTWPSGSLHRERFAPSNRPPLAKGAFEIELARSRQRLTVPAHRSLLSVLQEAGHSVTHSCTAGICGTCLVRVLAGVPQHNDDVLSDEERDAGDVMLVCVSRSESELLVLDL